MRVVVTRPQADGERTATALAARGHDTLLAPLMRIEPVDADLSGSWGAVVITSTNAPAAIANNPARKALIKTPVFAVGRRSAEAARTAGFSDVTSAGGDVRDLVRLLAERRADAEAPLIYLAGQARAADLIGELTARGIAARMRVVYRVVTAPLPSALVAALKEGDVQGVLHFSRRSAENYLAGAKAAGIIDAALAVGHYCLSSQVAEPLRAAGARRIAVAREPQETVLIELLATPLT